jgi:predicted TIM-barrel fold metal-dependent hydrolase
VNEFLTVAYSNPNIYVDLTFMDYIEKAFEQENLVEKVIRTLYNIIGAGRLLWGSEGPNMYLPLFGHHGPPEETAGEYYRRSQYELVKRFDFMSKEDQVKILGGNAAKLLKL